MWAEPLVGKTFGVTVGGVDIADVSDYEFADLESLLLRYGALVISGGCGLISKQQQVMFGKRFGQLEFGGAPMANTERNGTTIVAVEAQRMRTNLGNEMWHTDSTYKPLSSKVAMLSARELPPSGGGQTALVDMRAAYR